MSWIKKLFCKHEWKLVNFYHGSSNINSDGNYYDAPPGWRLLNVTSFGRVNHYKCKKCEKSYHRFIGGFKGLK